MGLITFRYILAAVVGLLMGSFGNVCIFRLPQKKSVVYPPSHCPKCQTPIRLHDNIPVLSYLLLGGRCRACKKTISFIYPTIEILASALSVATLWKFGWNMQSLFFYLFGWGLLVIIVIDLQHMIIPNILTYPGFVLGLIGGVFFFSNPWWQSVGGALIGGGLLWIVGWAYFHATKRVGLGGGDIKLMAVVGAFLGIELTVLTIFFSSFLGAFVGLYILVVKKKSTKHALPFGPFIAAGALLALFFGWDIIRWYGTLW